MESSTNMGTFVAIGSECTSKEVKKIGYSYITDSFRELKKLSNILFKWIVAALETHR